MAPAVRSPWIEPAIITDRARNFAVGLPNPKKFPAPDRDLAVENPAAGNGIFWMQRREAKIGLRDRKRHRRPKEPNDTGENRHRNGLSRVGAGICGFVGLDGGDHLDQTGCSPRSHRNQSPKLESGTEFFAAETGRRNGLIRLSRKGNDLTPCSRESVLYRYLSVFTSCVT
jgi:hypothetical protein